jgi:ABC-type nitrate/sulfonate/bicarbonate transport system substrate-binding protein
VKSLLRTLAGLSALGSCAFAQTQTIRALENVTINYATRTGTTWPLYIAKEGGYFEKYGLNAKLAFGVHPAGIAMVVSGEAQMTNYPIEQAMQALSRDGSLVMLGSPYKKSLFALMAPQSIASVRDLKGKRIGVSQLGDAPYNYAVALLAKSGLSPRDVQWLTIGTDVNGRATALAAGRVDATMLTAPVYFKLEEHGFKSLANTSDYEDIYAPTVYVFKKTLVASNPKLPELLIKAHTEAIQRFYEDKAFAVKAYLVYNPNDNPAEVARVWEHYATTNTYERVPYISKAAVDYTLEHPADAQMAQQFRGFNFRTVIDNGMVDRLVKEGFFEKTFGAGIKAEQERKARQAFR